MEEEEKEAQSAKLQELIRRGSPEDLREANRLMKIMAGYDTRSKTNYRAKAAEEVSKIQAKARLLEERLEAFKPGDHMSDGDVFSELASALQSAQPKIQKMCEEESEDHEAVARLLEINDSIHRTVERYKLMKKGDMEGAAKVASGAPPSSDPSTSKSSSTSANELSLIDFDGEASNESHGSNGTFAAGTSQAGGLENDLLGLDIGGPSSTFGQGGNISLGFGTNSSKSGAFCRPYSPLPHPFSVRSRLPSSCSFRFFHLSFFFCLTDKANRCPWSGSAIFHHTRQQCKRQLVEPNRLVLTICILHVTSTLPIKHSSALSPATTPASSLLPGGCRSLCGPDIRFNADTVADADALLSTGNSVQQ